MKLVKFFTFLMTFIFINLSFGQTISPTCRKFKIDPGVTPWTHCTAIARKDVIAYLGVSKKPLVETKFFFRSQSESLGNGKFCCEEAIAGSFAQCESSSTGSFSPGYTNIKKYCYVESCTCVNYSSN